MPTGNPVWLFRNASMSNTDCESQWTVIPAPENPSRSLFGSIRKGLSRKSSDVSTRSNTSVTSQEPQAPSFRDPADLTSLNTSFQQASLGEHEARRRSLSPLTNPSRATRLLDRPGMNEPPPAYTPSPNAASSPTPGSLPSGVGGSFFLIILARNALRVNTSDRPPKWRRPLRLPHDLRYHPPHR